MHWHIQFWFLSAQPWTEWKTGMISPEAWQRKKDKTNKQISININGWHAFTNLLCQRHPWVHWNDNVRSFSSLLWVSHNWLKSIRCFSETQMEHVCDNNIGVTELKRSFTGGTLVSWAWVSGQVLLMLWGPTSVYTASHIVSSFLWGQHESTKLRQGRV